MSATALVPPPSASAAPTADFKNLNRAHQQMIERNIESRLQQIQKTTRRDLYRRSFSVAPHPGLQRSHSFDSNSPPTSATNSGASTPRGGGNHPRSGSGGTLHKVGQMFVKMSPSLKRKRRKKNLSRTLRSEREKKADPRVYGVPLKTTMSQQEYAYPDLKVPRHLVYLRRALRPHLETEGIFRVAGDANEIAQLRELIDSGASRSELNLESCSGTTLADVFKLYFKCMPSPLFPHKMYNKILAEVKKADFKGASLTPFAQALPAHNKALLDFLEETLLEVASVPENRMDLTALSICFSPNLLWMKDSTPMRELEDARVLHVCLLSLTSIHLETEYGMVSTNGSVPHDVHSKVVERAALAERLESIPARPMLISQSSCSKLSDSHLSVGGFGSGGGSTSSSAAGSASHSRSHSPSGGGGRRKKGTIQRAHTMTRSSSTKNTHAVVSPPVEETGVLRRKGGRRKSRWILPKRSHTATGPMSTSSGSQYGRGQSPSPSSSISSADSGGGFGPQLGQLLAPTPEMLQLHRRTLSNVNSRANTPRGSALGPGLVAVQENGIVFPKLRRISHTLPKAATSSSSSKGLADEEAAATSVVGISRVQSQPSTLQRGRLSLREHDPEQEHEAMRVVIEDRLNLRMPSQDMSRISRKRSDTAGNVTSPKITVPNSLALNRSHTITGPGASAELRHRAASPHGRVRARGGAAGPPATSTGSPRRKRSNTPGRRSPMASPVGSPRAAVRRSTLSPKASPASRRTKSLMSAPAFLEDSDSDSDDAPLRPSVARPGPVPSLPVVSRARSSGSNINGGLSAEQKLRCRLNGADDEKRPSDSQTSAKRNSNSSSGTEFPPRTPVRLSGAGGGANAVTGGTVGRHSGAKLQQHAQRQGPYRHREKRRSVSLPNVFVFAVDEDDLTEYEYDTETDTDVEGLATIG